MTVNLSCIISELHVSLHQGRVHGLMVGSAHGSDLYANMRPLYYHSAHRIQPVFTRLAIFPPKVNRFG